MKSEYINSEYGKFHVKRPEINEGNLPVTLFLHGASKKSQHTEFWRPLLRIIQNYTFPILVDRFGHGRSEGRGGMKSNGELISKVLHIYLGKNNQDKGYIIGRSAGAKFALDQLEQNSDMIQGLGLIAPASLSSMAHKLSNFEGTIAVLWDIDDPVVNFSNYSYIESFDAFLFTVGSHTKAIKSVARSEVAKSHAPELKSPELFEEFLSRLTNQ